MSIITLTTDFGLKDHFVGATKGKILSEINDVSIIDITHEIAKFNVVDAGYCILAAYKNFPKDTVHIIGVNSERVNEAKHLVIYWENQYFICADNGILSFLIQKKIPEKIFEIIIHDRIHSKFDMDVFISVACHLCRGGKMNVIGREISTENIKTFSSFLPKISDDKSEIKGTIIYIDDFGNCVTNISKTLFLDIQKNRSFEISFSGKINITRINKYYGDFVNQKSLNDGKALAIFNENEFLEIAIYKSDNKNVGSANSLLGLDYRDSITVNFK